MDVIPRDDPAFAPSFAKDPHGEDLLALLNTTLAPVEETLYEDLEEELPTLHVIGVPRSGTTLLYQVIAAGLEVGYVDNLVAAFWRAPVLGLRLAHKLGTQRQDPSFSSAFGRTSGVGEPHEFGYFWNHHLRYPGLSALPKGHEDEIEWEQLRRVLVNMARWSGVPLAFKPMLLTWHLERMLREMPLTCFVWVRRSRHDTALSLLDMRLSLFGTYDEWASLRPVGADWLGDEPPWRQVAAQVVALERTIESAVARMGAGSVLEVSYDDLCTAPGGVLERVRALLGSKGFEPARREIELPTFEPRRRDPLEDELGTKVDEALEHYAASPAVSA